MTLNLSAADNYIRKNTSNGGGIQLLYVILVEPHALIISKTKEFLKTHMQCDTLIATSVGVVLNM